MYTSCEEAFLDHEEEEENPGYYSSLNVPYIAGFSESLIKDLKVIDVGVTFSRVELSTTHFAGSNLHAQKT